MATYVDNSLAQFENTNSLRSYPFENGVALVDSNKVEVSRDVVVDLHLVVPGEVPEDTIVPCDLPVVRMTSLHLSPYMVSVCFSVGDGSGSCALSATVSTSNFKPYSPVRLEKLIGAEDIGGIVTFGDIQFPGNPETHFFDNAIVHRGCVSIARPVRLRKFIDKGSGESLYGDVKIRFSGYVDSVMDGNSCKLSLKEGAYDELASSCSDTSTADVCGATPIKTINGVLPDSDGNIVLWFH